jgi:hypothetical protein
MRIYQAIAIVAAVAIAVILLIGLLNNDPLVKLERAALAQSFYSGAAELPSDDTFYWSAQRIEHILENDLGATVVYGQPPVEGALGVTNTQTREITIDSTEHWTGRFETLAHEAAHLLQPRFSTRQEGEAFAEAVAYVVAIHDGDYGALRRSSRYLAGAKNSLHILREYRAEILRAAAFLE